MNKLKTLLLLTLGAAALTAQAQGAQERTKTAQQVIDALTANGGHCQTIYYSASYQQDLCSGELGFTNNMWIKDSFGKAHFEQRNTGYIDWVDYDGLPGIQAKEVTLVDAFGGLFDWDFVISEDGANNMSQYVDKMYQAKGEGNEHKYVRVHVMTPDNQDWFSKSPIRRGSVSDLSTPEQLQAWLSEADVSNFEWIGVTPWGHANFDESIFLTPYWGTRANFLRIAIKNDGPNEIRGDQDDVEEMHYDFYMAEFRHYNPNTIINDTHNGEGRSFEAISDIDTETGDFYVHNFSGFGPLYTQELGTLNDDDLSGMLNGTGLTQLNRGYGEGKDAQIQPLHGHFLEGGLIKILRSENPAGFTHYHRAYEAVKNVEGVTAAQIEANKFNPAITLWHDNKIAGLVEGQFERDANGIIIPSSITALKDEVSGTWTNSHRHHHANNGVASEATNPWVTDGGTCRTVKTVNLKVDPYVYCTDEQLAAGQNGTLTGTALYDTDDEYKRGGIYELVDIEATKSATDITLDLAINNSNGEIVKNMQKVIKTDGQNNVISEHVAVPVEFTVNDNDQYVDHYELCIHECNGIHDVTVASDEAFANADSPLNEAMNDLVCTYTLEKDNYSSALRDTDGPKLYKAYVESGEYDKETGAPIYTKVPNFDLPKGRDYVTLTIFVKAVYTEESGLAPTYHSLQNVHVKHDTIVTGIDDINVESVKTSKVLENGQVFIIKNGVKYNTMGQRVK